MKKLITPAILLVLLLGLSTTPAQAIFGLSKCEKVAKSVLAEEKITFELWNIWDKERNKLKSSGKLTWNQLGDLMQSSIPMTESDNEIYKIMNANKSCFKSKVLAEARIDYYQNIENIKIIRNTQKEISSGKINGKSIITKKSADSFFKVYATFYDLISDKHLDQLGK